MNFTEFAAWVNHRWDTDTKYAGRPREELAIVALGLAGETGESIEHIKKFLRGDGDPVNYEKFILEMGDVLHYWMRLVHLIGVSHTEVIEGNLSKLEARDRAKAAK